MEKGKVDRRVRYTKALLKGALVDMLQEQHISSISIKALCERADVNRSTFYAHYKDQYDLLEQVEEEVNDNLRKSLSGEIFKEYKDVSNGMLTRILEYLKKNATLCKVLLSSNSGFRFQDNIIALAQLVTDQMVPNEDVRNQEYLNLFGVTGAISVVQKWLDDGMIETPAQISELILRASMYGLNSRD